MNKFGLEVGDSVIATKDVTFGSNQLLIKGKSYKILDITGAYLIQISVQCEFEQSIRFGEVNFNKNKLKCVFDITKLLREKKLKALDIWA